MKKILAALLCALLVCLALAPASFALGETCTAKKGVPVIDGVVDEIWAQTDRVQMGYLKGGDLMANGTPEVYTGYASTLWNDNYLYFLFEVTDDDIFCNNLADSTWKNECIFIYVDETNQKSSLYQAGDGTYQLAFLTNGDQVVPRNGTINDPAATTSAAVVNGNSFVIEVAFKCEVATLAAGNVVGVDFQYNDATEGGTRDYCYGWSDETDNANADCSIWGEITLLADEAKVAEPVVEVAPEPEPVVETPVVEEPVVVAEPVVEAAPVAAQTADMTSIVTLIAGIAALSAFTVSKIKK